MNAEAIFNIGLSIFVMGTGLIVLAAGTLLCVLVFYYVAEKNVARAATAAATKGQP